MIKWRYQDVRAGDTLVVTDDLARDMPECFCRGAKLKVKFDRSGLLCVNCRVGGVHPLLDFIGKDDMLIGFENEVH